MERGQSLEKMGAENTLEAGHGYKRTRSTDNRKGLLRQEGKVEKGNATDPDGDLTWKKARANHKED